MIKLYTKHDISNLMDLSYKTLRIYEEKELIKPAYINPQNGYKYYDEDSLYTIAMIRYSNMDLDIPLNEIKNVLDTSNHQTALIALLQKKKEEAEQMVQKYQQIIENIEHSLAFNQQHLPSSKPNTCHIKGVFYFVRLRNLADNLNLWTKVQKMYELIGHKHVNFLLQFDSDFSECFTRIGTMTALPEQTEELDICQEEIDCDFLCFSFKDYSMYQQAVQTLDDYASQHGIALDKTYSFLECHSLDVSTLTLEDTIMTIKIKISNNKRDAV